MGLLDPGAASTRRLIGGHPGARSRPHGSLALFPCWRSCPTEWLGARAAAQVNLGGRRPRGSLGIMLGVYTGILLSSPGRAPTCGAAASWVRSF